MLKIGATDSVPSPKGITYNVAFSTKNTLHIISFNDHAFISKENILSIYFVLIHSWFFRLSVFKLFLI